MAVCITVGIPEPLHDALRSRAERSGTSIHSLIVRTLEERYAKPPRGTYVNGPLVKGAGKLGPDFPVDKNPHDLMFS